MRTKCGRTIRRGALAGWGLLVVLGATPAGATTEFPIASTGDIWFHADHAGFRDEEGKVVEEYYVRVTNNQLQFEEGERGWEGRVQLKLRFRSEDGDGLGEVTRNYTFVVPDDTTAASADDVQLFLAREPLDPRAAEVEIVLEDMNARKRGLLYLITGSRRSGSARGYLRPPPAAEAAITVSDIQFAWVVTKADSTSAFVKHDLNVIPNPARAYGRLQPTLSTYYEVYDERELDDSTRVYVIEHEFVDVEGRVVAATPDTVASGSKEWVKVVSFDVTNLPTGPYVIRARVQDLDGEVVASSEGAFNVLWQSELWDRSEQDILDEARVLLSEKEYDRFKAMSAGDRAQYLNSFWDSADPTPGTVQNEIRDEFEGRVDYANLHFSRSGRKGMLTDQGRIYIRYGPPDEIDRELMPTQGRQLDRQVADLTRENAQGSRLGTTDAVDTRPYEIWYYTRQGAPLFPDRERGLTTSGLRFIFVDDTGAGHWNLHYSSDFIGY
jgi:GWxTD domain-containing protein